MSEAGPSSGRFLRIALCLAVCTAALVAAGPAVVGASAVGASAPGTPIAEASAVGSPSVDASATGPPVADAPVHAASAVGTELTDPSLSSSAAAADGEPCAGVSDAPAVVVTPPADDPRGPNQTVRTYAGSDLDVWLCPPAGEDDTDRTLDLEGVEGLDVRSTSGDHATVRVEGPVDESLGEYVSPDPVAGPTVAVVDLTVEIDLLEEPVVVADPEQASPLEDADAAFRAAESTYETRLHALDRAVDAVADGDRPDPAVLNATVEARSEYLAASDDLRTALYDVAASSDGYRGAAALSALADRDEAVEATATETFRSYDEALAQRDRDLTWSLRFRIAGLVGVGAVLGVAAGAYLPVRRGRWASRRIARGEWTTYSRRIVRVPLAAGLTLLAVGGFWLALQVGWPIVGVFT